MARGLGGAGPGTLVDAAVEGRAEELVPRKVSRARAALGPVACKGLALPRPVPLQLLVALPEGTCRVTGWVGRGWLFGPGRAP